MAFAELDGIDLMQIVVIKVDGMQHCTLYLDDSLTRRLENLSPEFDLCYQLAPALTRQTAPIWEDRSTGAEVARLNELADIKKLTANRAELRFPAAQILKWGKEPDYVDTAHIMLLSAFMTSVLIGRPAPVDTGDGWGTNLNHMDAQKPGWNSEILSLIDQVLGGQLGPKLGQMVPYDTSLGLVSSYFVRKYGLNPEAMVLAGTGDNPATLMGCGGRTTISLGSSYTINGPIESAAADLECSIFGYRPLMALMVITNGAKVHDHFRRYYGVADWDAYADLAGESGLRPDEPLMLPYLSDESVPLRPSGIVRDGLDENVADANIRALHISQALSLKLRAASFSESDSICIVGGASKNLKLCQFITDIFQKATYSIANADYAAPLGCAISGAKYVLGSNYEETRFIRHAGVEMIPDRNNSAEKLLMRYAALEVV